MRLIKKLLFIFLVGFLIYKISSNFGYDLLNLSGENTLLNTQIFKTSAKNKTLNENKIFTPQFTNNQLIVSTFNVEWLGDGEKDRKKRAEKDYKNIASVISEIGADIIGLQEIENKKAVEKILKYIKGYSYVMAPIKSGQNVVFLYSNNLKIKRTFSSDRIDVEGRSTRPAIVIEAKKGNFDFVVTNVHFKSSSHFDNTPEKKARSVNIRTRQADALTALADSIINEGKEKDVILLGDFNDTPVRKKNPTLLSLINNPNLVFITQKLKSCKYRSAYAIDHIIVSQSAYSRYIDESLRYFDTQSIFQEEELKNISDHCPVIVNFDIKGKDND